jgi:hypothetical protein
MTTLDDIARAAQAIPGIESAAIFVKDQAAARLDLGAAAGVDGAALSGLVAAVQQAEHPIAQAMTDAAPTFNVQPMNPGGPALRSHLPLGGLGVLALSHEAALSAEARQALVGLAASAEGSIRASRS